MTPWWERFPPEYPVGECQCGCGGRTRLAVKSHTEKMWVAGKPRRFLKGHHTRQSGREYDVNDAGCWVWLLAKTVDGYPLRWNGTQMGRAHRMYYERLVGPIPEGLTLDHLCRNRACVNPAHLEPVTHQENVRRRPRRAA